MKIYLLSGEHEKANAIWSEGGTGCWEFKVNYIAGLLTWKVRISTLGFLLKSDCFQMTEIKLA